MEQKGNRKKEVIAALLFFLGVAVCLAVALLFAKNMDSSEGNSWQETVFSEVQTAKEQLQPEPSEGTVPEIIPEEEVQEVPEEEVTSEPFLTQVTPEGEWAERLRNHSSEEFIGKEYGEPVNCIDEEVSYEIEYEYYSYAENEDIDICASVVQLKGNIPNLTEINEWLNTRALDCANWGIVTRDQIVEQNEIYHVETDSYVTYNDEKIISIVIRDRYTEGEKNALKSWDYLMVCNVNPETGELLMWQDIVDMTGCGAEFKRRVEEEGKVSQELKWLKEDDYEDILTSDPLVFFTPLGMQVGMNNINMKGFMTISWEE